MLRRCVWSRNIKNGCSIYIYDISHLRVKYRLKFSIVWKMSVKFIPVHTIKAYSSSETIVSVILNLGTGLWWVVSFVPWPFYLRYLVIGGCVGSRAGLDILEKIKLVFPAQIQISYCEAGIINCHVIVNFWLIYLTRHYHFRLLLVLQSGARVGAVGWGTALQAGRSLVRFPMVSLDFSLT